MPRKYAGSLNSQCPPLAMSLEAITDIVAAGMPAVGAMTSLLPVLNWADFTRSLTSTGVPRFVIQSLCQSRQLRRKHGRHGPEDGPRNELDRGEISAGQGFDVPASAQSARRIKKAFGRGAACLKARGVGPAAGLARIAFTWTGANSTRAQIWSTWTGTARGRVGFPCAGKPVADRKTPSQCAP